MVTQRRVNLSRGKVRGIGVMKLQKELNLFIPQS